MQSARSSGAFARPTDEEIALAMRLLAPWRALVSPVFDGLSRIPEDRPLLFVGNHTLFGLLDVPLLFAELYQKQGIFLRALGDHDHFKIPFWGDLLRKFGVVDGTRASCSRLMHDGEAVLVFPGGAREVAKRKGEKYKLLWGSRLGFARMAIRHACTIVPFSAVGAEETFDIVYDAEDFFATPLGRVAKKLGIRTDAILPFAKGALGTPLPKPERFYFHIGQPISTVGYGMDDHDLEACREVRDKTKLAVESGIALLQVRRTVDPERYVLGRLVKSLLP